MILALTLAVGLGIGLGIAWLAGGQRDGGSQPSVQALDVPGDAAAAADGGAPAAPAPAPPEEGSAPPVASATSPEAAVEGFLTAEALQDFEASYEYLAQVDRETTYGTAAGWVAEHADLLPVTGFEIEAVEGGDVTTITALDSRLDPVLGLVPARARGTWTTVEEDDGWRVSYSSSTLEPLYPSDEGVEDAARTWAGAAQECTGGEVDGPGSLLGQPALADELCGAEGELVLGAAGVLTDGPDTTVLLNAYGPEVFTWARVVPVQGPVELRLVLAPVDDAWQVFGILPPPV